MKGSFFFLQKIYPNPASTIITIQFNYGLQNDISLELFNVYGQKVKGIHEGISPGNGLDRTIDISNLSAGIYFVKIGG